MSFKAVISNTTDQFINAYYRMPKESELQKKPILEVIIYPRALMQEIIFTNELFYKEWKKQNESFFINGFLVEGKSNEEFLQDKSNENILKENEKVQEKVEKNIEKLQEASGEMIEFELKKVDPEEEKKRRRGKETKNRKRR